MSTAILAPGSRGRRLSKRLLQVVITLFGLLLLTFTIGRVMPIDPVLAIVGPDADQSTYQQVYQQLGFDKSLTTQFGIYFVNLLHGDLGNALLTGKPVVCTPSNEAWATCSGSTPRALPTSAITGITPK